MKSQVEYTARRLSVILDGATPVQNKVAGITRCLLSRLVMSESSDKAKAESPGVHDVQLGRKITGQATGV